LQEHGLKLQQRVTSVNIGSLREVPFGGRTVTTGFFKHPVEHPVVIGVLGLEGDAQADHSVHGGLEKAVYLYPREHYPNWQDVLQSDLEHGSFGENITTDGLLEDQLFIGDVIRFGNAILQVIQPRSPCYKLQVRFGRQDMLALFLREGRPGWYASVLQEGTVGVHDQIELVERTQGSVSIADVWRYSFSERASANTSRQILGLSLLPDFWKERVTRA
jgi:MOSC domain-containing protein YiiM